MNKVICILKKGISVYWTKICDFGRYRVLIEYKYAYKINYRFKITPVIYM